jgi:hypothetical protein
MDLIWTDGTNDWRTGVFAQVHQSVPYQFSIDFLK